jgi:hypothetical protein
LLSCGNISNLAQNQVKGDTFCIWIVIAKSPPPPPRHHSDLHIYTCMGGCLFVHTLSLIPILWFSFKGCWDLNSEPHEFLMSHTTSPFGFTYFSNRVLHLCLGTCGPGSSYLYFPYSWEDGSMPPHLAFYWLRWGLTNFLPRLASNLDPPIQFPQ